MQNQNTNPIGQDPKTSSTPGTPVSESGESLPQTGEEIVNEQEQNKPVNQEEFIDDAAQNTKDANKQAEDGSLPSN